MQANARDCDAIAQYRLFVRLQDPEPERALNWLRLSAHGGHGLARYTYAYVFRYGGDLVASDNVQAYLWYSQALSSHIVYVFEIPRKRKDLAARMTEAEIAEAERLLAGWEPTPCEPETAAKKLYLDCFWLTTAVPTPVRQGPPVGGKQMGWMAPAPGI